MSAENQICSECNHLVSLHDDPYGCQFDDRCPNERLEDMLQATGAYDESEDEPDPLQAALEAEAERRTLRAAHSSWQGTKDLLGAAFGVKP
jgi:hypothetical protein